MSYTDSLKSMYVQNPSYTPVLTSERSILQSWESNYGRLNNWDRFYPYPLPTKVSLPNAYTLFKNKSLSKFRPITSYAAHPYKRLFNAAARGLNFILENCDARHFNLAKICDFKRVIEKFNVDELRSLCYPDSVIAKALNRVISHSRFTDLS